MADTSFLERMLPQGYGYVLLTTVSTAWLNSYLGGRTTLFRRDAGIKYPQVMAERSQMDAATPEMRLKMHKFNLAQRGHHNFLENQENFIFSSLIAGLRYPQTTAWLGAVWIVCRVIYAIGYTRSDEQANGKGRFIGYPWMPAQFVLNVMATLTAFRMIK